MSQSTFHLSEEEKFTFAECRIELEHLRERTSELENRLHFSLQEARDAGDQVLQLRQLNLELTGDLQDKEDEVDDLNHTLNKARVVHREIARTSRVLRETG